MLGTYPNYIHKSRYARYLPGLSRRETWEETVDRYIKFFKTRSPRKAIPWDELRAAILNLEIMPSMRCLMTAGPALDRDNVAGYNCAYVAVDDVRVFDEIMYVLMCGTGVGFSVERQYVSKLPSVAEEFIDVDTVITVRDSKIGWASSLRQLISLLYNGNVPRWDLSKIRPAGSPLKTFGGRASGPEPLDDLFQFAVRLFRKAAGRKLQSIEAHDLICKIADVVVCGGVRRSALLSLSNLTDERMRQAKTGSWFDSDPHRSLANNSVAYTEKPDIGIFIKEWHSLYSSKSGERGIFNREAATLMAPKRRVVDGVEFGTNPCSEIVLRSKQFCNLTEVVARPDDTLDTLRTKVRLATILGTLQATLTDFRYLSRKWKENTDEERLLGVSITGIMDCTILVGSEAPSILQELKSEAIKTNEEFARVLKIPKAAAITCVKPSGTVSQLVSSASGIHPRYSDYYIRRVRASVHDPICDALRNAGVPCETSRRDDRELVFSFPIKSPDGARTVDTTGAIEQLELWKTWAVNYCEHKPSVSIYVKEGEWLDVAAWCYENWDILNGVSFFPHDDHIYPQAPYEKITKEQYDEIIGTFPKEIDLNVVEELDGTTASQEIACQGGACEL